jgi:hypothetical protein
VLGHLLPSALVDEPGKRHEIALPDGDRLVGFLHEGRSDAVVYLFHGLTGDVDANYIHGAAGVCERLGHTVFRVNHRGCGAGAGLARLPYHSGRGEDLSAAIAYGRALFPSHRHLAIGFSLSGNALLLLLSGERGETLPDLAISVNAPIDLSRAARALERGLNRIYDLNFVQLCRWEVRRRVGRETRTVPWYATLRDFDEAYTAREAGFRDREDYYARCSTKDRLHKIRTPTLLLTAEDDPFVEFEAYREARLSPSVRLHSERSGGHIGYLSRDKTSLGTRRWLDYALFEGISGLLA